MTELNYRELPFLNTKVEDDRLFNYPTRFGTPIEKGVSLTEEKIKTLEKRLQDKIAFWTLYPDLWADEVLIPSSSTFEWKTYQRVQLRAQARRPLIHGTAARGVSKTFVGVFGFFHKAIFYPGSSWAITAPSKKQAADIARQTVNDILSRFPLLQNELDGDPVGTGDAFLVRFKNESTIEITAAIDSTRGRRFDGILVDEARDQNGDNVNSILVPTVSKNRLTAGAGILNPKEIRQTQWYFTSASSKSSYNYEKVLYLFKKMILNPKSAFVFGLDYRIPVLEGIYPASFVRDIKYDGTVNEQVFAREYLSVYTTENDDSWFNFNKLNIHRKIVNAQWQAYPSDKKDKDVYFLISIDVARKNDNTVVTVFKVKKRRDQHYAKVANIYVLGRTLQTKHFTQQVIAMKKIIYAFDPVEVVIDTNGLGVSIADLMIEEQIDEKGISYGPLGFHNDDDYKKIQPPSAPRILYSFKATKAINSEMFGICYSRIDAGLVDFLIKEQEARSKLLATKKGQNMTLEQRTKFLMPYEMTTKLFQEMGNLRLKRTGTGLDIVLEPINSRFPDDRFSSLCIGLRRIKQLEDEDQKKKRKNKGKKRVLTFFSGGSNERR